MFVPQFADNEFVSASVFTQAASDAAAGTNHIGQYLHTPGVIAPVSLSAAASGLTVTFTCNTPMGIVFGSGVLAQPLGTVDGATSHVYPVTLTSLVPGSGAVTAYLVAQQVYIQQNSYEVTGPPLGHPDFDPTFVPFTAYSRTAASFSVTAQLTPADGVTTIELGRVGLAAGQVSIATVDVSHIVRGGAVLSQNGEVVAADLAAGAAATNVGTLGGVLTGTLPNPGMAAGAAATNVGTLGGALTGTLPNPGLAAGVGVENIGTLGAVGGALTGTLPDPGLATGVAATNVGDLGGVLTGTLPDPGMAAGAAAVNVGTLGGVLGGTLPNPTMKAGAASTNVGTLGGVLNGSLPNPGMATGAAAANVGTLGGSLTGSLPNPGLTATGISPGGGQVSFYRAHLNINADGRVAGAGERTAWVYSSAAPGAGSVTVPDDCTGIAVWLTAGGGGGEASNGSLAGGGGGAGMTAFFVVPCTPNETFNFNLGAGGSGGIAYSSSSIVNSNPGASSTFGSAQVSGGYPGQLDLGATGGQPGALSACTLGGYYGVLLFAGYGGCGSYSSAAVGGHGGASFWGGGSSPFCGIASVGPAPTNGNAPGSGGGGGYGVVASGKAGQSGCVVVMAL